MNKEKITKEDILNVTGSMFDTMFDYVDNSNKELEQLQQELYKKNKIIEELKNKNKKLVSIIKTLEKEFDLIPSEYVKELEKGCEE